MNMNRDNIEDEKKSCDMVPENLVRRLARPNILNLSPYRCARDDYDDGILLDANENAFGPPYPPQEENRLSLERYPCPYQIPLKSRFAQYRYETGQGALPLMRPENIFVGVGSDEAIDLLMRIFCAPGHDQILTTPPTYGMYSVCADVNDVGIVEVPLTPDFDFRVDEVLAASTEKTKLLFVCSPGNPTSKVIPLTDVERLLKCFEGIVVVDEAYIDFCPPQFSAVSLMEKYQNLVVLQTLSKAFGLAGIRMGFALSGNTELIQLMNNVKAPYNVNKLTSDTAREALRAEHVAKLQDTISTVLMERAKVISKLMALDFVTRVYPSDSNFVLFQLKRRAKEIYKIMADRGGVVTRYRGSQLHCDECIRVTIGTQNENEEFFRQLHLAWEKVQDE